MSTTASKTNVIAAPAPYEMARLAALDDAHERARAVREKYERDLDAVSARRSVAQADAAAAERDHLADGGEELLERALAARDAFTKAQADVTTAAEALRLASDAERAAAKRLDEARLEQRKVDLQTSASVGAFYAKAQPHFGPLLAALASVREHARAIDAARNTANEAAAELRRMGERTTDLDVLHLLPGFVRSHVEAAPSRIRAIVLGIDGLRRLVSQAPESAGGPVLETALLGTLDGLAHINAAIDTPLGDAEGLREDLEAMLGARSRFDGTVAVQEARFRRGDFTEVNRRRVMRLPAPDGFVAPLREPWLINEETEYQRIAAFAAKPYETKGETRR